MALQKQNFSIPLAVGINQSLGFDTDDADRAMIEERQKRELTPAEKEYVYRVWLSNNPGRR